MKEGMNVYIADLHIHSRYSRATSKDCTPEYLDLWARRKGIQIVGTGDFTHPAWREELKEKLQPAEDGLYILKDEYRIKDETVRGSMTPRFVVTGEISSIYKKNGKVRKVHSLILLPGLEEAEEIAGKLEEIGNIHSDGRPILGLPCRDLLEILLMSCRESIYVPAHIWTPHFSLFGAFSGFDSAEECFEDLTPYIHAVETGLSSDPPMNWRVSALDRYHLISNSDAHSPSKLGREANLLDIELSYEGLRGAIQEGKGLCGTIEFFPEEGKYHLDGHRKCGISLTPAQTQEYHGVCPVCGKKITIGVYHRVEELADRDEGYQKPKAASFESLVPLPEVIGASLGYSSSSRKVQKEYEEMLGKLGAEFDILRKIPLEDVQKAAGHRIAEGILRLRQGKVDRIPGFDGEYGTIRLFGREEIKNTDGQMDFFGLLGVDPDQKEKKCPNQEESAACQASVEEAEKTAHPKEETLLNAGQQEAVQKISRHLAVIAGPGTGKTRTLIARILYLLEYRKVRPSRITAVTFTNQAAGEMKERLKQELGSRRAGCIQIGTFHSICLDYLKKAGMEFSLAEEHQCKALAQKALQDTGLSVKEGEFLQLLSRKKACMLPWEEVVDRQNSGKMKQAESLYEAEKHRQKLLDFDDLLWETLQLLRSGKSAGTAVSWLLIDEFQDLDPLQYELVKAWDKEADELFVIGDPDQSIYGFRGADAACFDRLQKDVEDGREEMTVIRLQENYRSTPQILEAARHMQGCMPLLAHCPSGSAVRLIRAGSEQGEALFIAREIGRMAGGIGMLEAEQLSGSRERKMRAFDDIAVLCRTHRQARIVERCLAKEGIPYVVAGREAFLQDEKVQGSICFFQYLENGQDTEAAAAAELLLGLEWNRMSQELLHTMAEKYSPLFTKRTPGKFMKIWMEDLALTKEEAVCKMAAMTPFYKTMSQFLHCLELGVESDLKRTGGKQYHSGAVTVMTLHGSKGLEFPAVFIYGVREGTIPLESENHPANRKEEQRLLYVGMTRAKEELILTCSGEESSFLQTVPEGLLQREELKTKKKEVKCHQMSLFEKEEE